MTFNSLNNHRQLLRGSSLIVILTLLLLGMCLYVAGCAFDNLKMSIDKGRLNSPQSTQPAIQ